MLSLLSIAPAAPRTLGVVSRRQHASLVPNPALDPQHVRLFVRIYRDYSIADFVFVTLATLGVDGPISSAAVA